MRRLSLGLLAAAMIVLVGCSSDTPTTELDGRLSANNRAEESPIQATATTRRRPRTTTTRRPRPNTTTTRRRGDTPVPQPTTPTTPTTMSRTGVSGAVLYERDCAADRPCKLEPGPAQLRLLSGKTVIARGNSRDSGAFVIEAAPGNYTLEAKPPTRGETCDPVSVTVPADGYAIVQVFCGAK